MDVKADISVKTSIPIADYLTLFLVRYVCWRTVRKRNIFQKTFECIEIHSNFAEANNEPSMKKIDNFINVS